MSKIVFWSPLHGQGQTSNLHIISLLMSLMYKRKVLMMQTHMSMNNLEGPLTGKSMGSTDVYKDYIYQDIGLDAAVMYSRIGMLTDDILESCCITFPDTSLLLLPGTQTHNREIFEKDISNSICRMVSQAEDKVDIVMIDANSGNDDLSFKLMSSADVVVINLTQRRYILNKLFLEYGDILKKYKKVFFIFGNYDRFSGYNIMNCIRKLGKYISNEITGVIPYCSKYMDAQNDGNILGMVREGLDSKKAIDMYRLRGRVKRIINPGSLYVNETDYFFSQACHTTIKIFNLLNTDRREALTERSRI
jgi:cellulose biosynthesis protein BcsQ